MNDKSEGFKLDLPYMEMGSGFAIGLAVGYFLKKSLKAVLILAGLILVAMFIIESQGIVQINEAKLDEAVNYSMGFMDGIYSLVKERLQRLTTAGSSSAIAGFAVGLKWG